MSETPIPDGRTTDPLDVPESGTIRVAFLIAADAEIVDFGGPWGVFEYVFLGDDWRRPFELYTVAATSDPVTVSGGMVIVPNYDFATAPAPDLVVVPAMDTEALSDDVYDWLRQIHERTAITMSVCNGSFVLGKAGLLDGKEATSHHHGYGLFHASFPGATLLRGRRFVEDGNIATAGGLTSGIDLALRVVERYFGRDVARETASKLEYQGTGWMHPDSNSEFLQPPTASDDRPVCPVCEMQVSKDTPRVAELGGRTWYFCCKWCLDTFNEAPERFSAVA